jgi:hypothetical protein
MRETMKEAESAGDGECGKPVRAKPDETNNSFV